MSSSKSFYDNLTARVFSLQKDDTSGFENLALEIFKLQYTHNKIYKKFVDALEVEVANVTSLTKIPFLPIELFKTQKIVTEFAELNNPVTFTSSGTTQTGTSFHYVNDVILYEKSFTTCFNLYFLI